MSEIMQPIFSPAQIGPVAKSQTSKEPVEIVH